MDSEIEQPLGDIERAHADTLFEVMGQHTFVHRWLRGRARKMRGKARAQVVGCQDGKAACLGKSVAAQREYVGVRPHQHSEISMKSAKPADGVGTRIVETPSLAFSAKSRRWQEGFQGPFYRDRPRTRAAAAMR